MADNLIGRLLDILCALVQCSFSAAAPTHCDGRPSLVNREGSLNCIPTSSVLFSSHVVALEYFLKILLSSRKWIHPFLHLPNS